MITIGPARVIIDTTIYLAKADMGQLKVVQGATKRKLGSSEAQDFFAFSKYIETPNVGR